MALAVHREGGLDGRLVLVLARLDLALDPFLAGVVLALGPLGRAAEELLRALDRAHDDGVDGLADRRLDLVDDRLDLLRDAAEAEQAGEEGDRQRERAGEGVLDLLGDDPDVALGDGADRVQDRADEVHDLGPPLDDEHDDVVDHLARLDEGGSGVQEGDQPRDAGLDDLLDDEGLDAADHHLLEVDDLVLDPLPEARYPLGHEDLEDVDGLLEAGDDLLADELDHAVADLAVGEAEDLH